MKDKNPHAVQMGKLRMKKLGKNLAKYQRLAALAGWKKRREAKQLPGS